MPEGFLAVISGPSGAGKGTIIEKVIKSSPELAFSISATTRPPRPKEKEGIHYFFLTREEFEAKIKQNEFLEWAKVHEDYYGTPRHFIEARIQEGGIIILDIDVQGGLQVKKTFPTGVFIFIVPPTFHDLQERLLKRSTETPESLNRRLADARKEFGFLEEYDYLVTNKVLADAVCDVRSIIRAEKCKRLRRLKEIKNVLYTD